MGFTRRQILQMLLASGAMATLPVKATAASSPLIQKSIPGTSEMMPVIGLGTSRVFNSDISDEAAVTRLTEVLKIFFEQGGSMIDSSPMYGQSEEMIGHLLKQGIDKADNMFSATKVWTDGEQDGIDQMRQSLDYWNLKHFDLMQIHNLRDWQVHLKTLRQWKDQGLIRYIGITTYAGHDHEELMDILLKEQFDFVQLSYNILNRKAEKTILPIARDKGIAIIANRPFQRGDLFRWVRGKTLPSWASDIGCDSWAQVFLKYSISHPDVTCAIPGTSKPHHMRDNMAAQYGVLPDQNARQEIERYFQSVN